MGEQGSDGVGESKSTALEQALFLGLVADQSIVETVAWCKHIPGKALFQFNC